MDAIESLQAEKLLMIEQISNMREEHGTLLEERDVLHATLREVQTRNGVNPFMQVQNLAGPSRSPSATTFSNQNPWGPIGSGGTRTTSSRPDTPSNTPINSPAMQPRSFSFAAPSSLASMSTYPALTGSGMLSTNGSFSTLNPEVPVHALDVARSRALHARGNSRIDGSMNDEFATTGTLQDVLNQLGPNF